MKNLLHFKIRYLLYAPLLIVGLCNAQAFSTKETKVVLVSEDNSGHISQLVLFSDYQKMDAEQLSGEYPLSDFYLGMIDGSYEIQGTGIKPIEGSTIIMYTEKLLFPGVNYRIKANLHPGSRFDIGSVRAIIMELKKGELIIKV